MPTPLILFDQIYNGQMRKALAAHSKQGWVYILDRATGKPLIAVEEKPVPQEPRQKTAATQPIPGGDPTAPQCAEPVEGLRARLHVHAGLDRHEDRATFGVRRLGSRRLRSAIGLSVLHHRSLHAQVQPHRPGVGARHARVRLDHRARFAHQQAGVAEGSPVPGRIRQRSAGHRGRPAVPRRLGRIFSARSIPKPAKSCGASRPASARTRRRPPTRSTASSTSPSPRAAAATVSKKRAAIWSGASRLGGRLNPLNGPPAPPPIVTTATPPNPDRGKQ